MNQHFYNFPHLNQGEIPDIVPISSPTSQWQAPETNPYGLGSKLRKWKSEDSYRNDGDGSGNKAQIRMQSDKPLQSYLHKGSSLHAVFQKSVCRSAIYASVPYPTFFRDMQIY